MHKNSMDIMSKFVTSYLDNNNKLSILDVGSRDVYAEKGIKFQKKLKHTNYKHLFNNPNWTYTGLDIASGPNVDLVVDTDYKWQNVGDEQYDILISGQCLEHVEMPWRLVHQLERVCKKGGIIAVIAPFYCKAHRHPVDCWRYLPDGMRALFTKEVNFKELECDILENDTLFIGKKQ